MNRCFLKRTCQRQPHSASAGSKLEFANILGKINL